ncbi:Serine/threonine protein kinase [Klebsormidium nitens]|uniref:non-specific serine/threonine protein kinase n=1 Tax=Klebsormidium nitens TaxID=105231 RepID=A0A1Y1IC73_KLENI|nr:Serine/threonine protein kinase [Klebsormidium nitens]|eukprot:GAQ85688.1 Serine/threonine protein kinase [Klebsormidium nitens]
MARATLNDFVVIEELSKGSYGVVFKAMRKADRRTYALKKIPMDELTREEKEEVVDEARVLSQLDSKYVVKYYDCFREQGCLYIVMAYAAKGNLHDRIQSFRGRLLPEPLVWSFFLQTVLGLNHIHQNHIIHRDIKSLNIFLDANDVIKVGDLGVAKRTQRGAARPGQLAGTPAYLAPELLQNKPYSVRSDVWAMGVILYELCTRRLPFTSATDKGLAAKILAGKYAPISRADYSGLLSDMIRKLLRLTPGERPDTDEILAMPPIKAKMKELGLLPASRPASTAGLTVAPAPASSETRPPAAPTVHIPPAASKSAPAKPAHVDARQPCILLDEDDPASPQRAAAARAAAPHRPLDNRSAAENRQRNDPAERRPEGRKEAWGGPGESREDNQAGGEKDRGRRDPREEKENVQRQQAEAARPRVTSRYCVRCRRETVLCSHVRPERGPTLEEGAPLTSSQAVGLSVDLAVYQPSPFARRQNPDIQPTAGVSELRAGAKKPGQVGGRTRPQSAYAGYAGRSAPGVPNWAFMGSSMYESRLD